MQPHVVTYNSSISAYRQDQQWAEALKLFFQMSQSQVQPNVITYGAAITACEKGPAVGQVSGAFLSDAAV